MEQRRYEGILKTSKRGRKPKSDSEWDKIKEIEGKGMT